MQQPRRGAALGAPRAMLPMPSKAERTALFKRMDNNGNGLLSLARPSPTTLSSCAALALLTLLVNAGSLYRGGKGT